MDGTNEAPILTIDLLDELKARWDSAGAPNSALLRPGLSDAKMDALTEPLGLVVPREARTWWAWHDGSERLESLIGLGYAHLPLARAVEETVERRETAEQIAGDEADPLLWRWAWLPMSVNLHGGVFCVDGTTDLDAPRAPVYYSEPQFGAKDGRPRAGSLGEMVTWWLEAFDEGVYEYSHERNRWLYWDEKLDPVRERTRLV